MIINFHGIQCKYSTYRTSGENRPILTLVDEKDWEKSLPLAFSEPQPGLWCHFLTDEEIEAIPEIYYIEKCKEIGAKKGNCKELSDLCRQAYQDYQTGLISPKAYNRIYAICMDYAYPH